MKREQVTGITNNNTDIQARWIQKNSSNDGKVGLITRLCLIIFVTLQYLSLSRQGFMRMLGEEWNLLGYVANVGSIAIFVIFIASIRSASGRGYFRHFPDWARLWWWSVALLVTVAVYIGVFKYKYILKFVALDTVPYVLLLGMIIAGSKPDVFHYSTKLLFWFLYLAIPLNIYGLTDLGALASQSGVGDRYGIDSLAYETQSTLAAWPLLLLLSNSMKRRHAAVVFIAVILYAGMMVIFQKRIGVAVLIVMIALYVHQSLRHGGSPLSVKSLRRKSHLRLFTIVILIGSGLLAIAGRGVLAEQGKALLERLSARGATEYTQGALSVFTLENERIQIVVECFSSFDPLDWAIGRGMGGAFEWAGFNTRLLHTVRAEQVINQYFLPDLGYFGRREFEIGILMPLLKGGVLLFISFYVGIAAFLLRVRSSRRDVHSTATYYTLLFTIAYLLHGGGFIMGDTISLIVMGLAIGRCLFAINQNEKWNVRGI